VSLVLIYSTIISSITSPINSRVKAKN